MKSSLILNVKKFTACELCQTLRARELILQAITPCTDEGLATRDKYHMAFARTYPAATQKGVADLCAC